MKVGKSDRPGRSERIARPNKARSAAAVQAAGVTAPVATASVLGIPEAEFTPRVRDAIMTLMHEVERLRGELDRTRSRLDEMARAADQDMLLPILNRRAFVREIPASSRLPNATARRRAFYFDLDDFKAVNDAHGHAAGDAVLRHFAELLASQIRDTDVLARIGGDEFGVILAHVRLEQARKKGESLAQVLRERPPVWDGEPVKLTFSCGCYELTAGQSADLAMNEADRAMYTEKRAGSKPPKP